MPDTLLFCASNVFSDKLLPEGPAVEQLHEVLMTKYLPLRLTETNAPLLWTLIRDIRSDRAPRQIQALDTVHKFQLHNLFSSWIQLVGSAYRTDFERLSQTEKQEWTRKLYGFFT